MQQIYGILPVVYTHDGCSSVQVAPRNRYRETGDASSLLMDSASIRTTTAWLTKHLRAPYRLFMVNGHAGKAAVLDALGTKLFVEDRFRTVNNLLLRYPVMYKRPWNQGRVTHPGVIQVNDLRDTVPLVNLVCGVNPMRWPAYLQWPWPMTRKEMNQSETAD